MFSLGAQAAQQHAMQQPQKHMATIMQGIITCNVQELEGDKVEIIQTLRHSPI